MVLAFKSFFGQNSVNDLFVQFFFCVRCAFKCVSFICFVTVGYRFFPDRKSSAKLLDRSSTMVDAILANSMTFNRSTYLLFRYVNSRCTVGGCRLCRSDKKHLLVCLLGNIITNFRSIRRQLVFMRVFIKKTNKPS